MEELTLPDIIAILRRRKSSFFVTSSALAACSLIFSLSWSTYRSTATVEIEPSFAASYAANFGDHVFVGPIESVKRSDLPKKVDLVIGGPPCQAFSMSNVHKKSNDPRLTFAPWALYGDLPTCEQLHPQA